MIFFNRKLQIKLFCVVLFASLFPSMAIAMNREVIVQKQDIDLEDWLDYPVDPEDQLPETWRQRREERLQNESLRRQNRDEEESLRRQEVWDRQQQEWQDYREEQRERLQEQLDDWERDRRDQLRYPFQ